MSQTWASCSSCAPPRALPQSAVAPLPARCLRRGRPPPPAFRSVYLAPHRMPSFRLSAGSVGVQPASEFRHLQRHNHERHVLRALLPASPVPNLCSRALPWTLLAAAVARRLLPPDPYTSPRTACPPFDSRQSAAAFNQLLSFDTSSVTNMGGMFRVRSTPCLTPNLQSSPPLHAACATVARRLPPPGPHLAPHRMPSFRLGSTRTPSTSR